MVAQNGNSQHIGPPPAAPPPAPASEVSLSLQDLPRLHVHFPLKRFIAMIAFIGALIIAMIVYSAETGLRMSQRYTPLIDAAMEIKMEGTTAYLWYEEFIGGDPDATMDLVHKHMDLADWYARAMLEGGTNFEGVFIPLDDPQLRANIEDVRRLLAEFRTKMMSGNHEGGANEPANQSSNHIFRTFIDKADVTETRLQNLIQIAEKRFVTVQVVLAVTALAVMSLLGVLFVRFADTQNKAVVDLRREIFRRIRVENTLRKQATTDTLTGLLNRRRMTDILQDELTRANRLDAPFSVVMFDIDHFKRVNDTFGHEVGDIVLKDVAATVKSRLRELDAFAHWGGEEFIILLRGTQMDGALELSNICCKRLAQRTFKQAGQVTASFGVATWRKDETLRELIHRADEALYAAKNNGRNCVEIAKAG